MSKPGRRIVQVILTIVFGIFSLPALGFGLYLFSCWFRIHTTNVYYVEYPYIAVGFILVAVGAISVFCVLYGAWRKSFYGLLFAIPLVLGFATMVYIPDGSPHIQRSMIADTNYLSSVGSFIRVWYEANHRFPISETEFREALQNGPAAWQHRVESPPQLSFYGHGGERLPYEIVVMTNATGPRMEYVSTRPGVIYYCVSKDQQEFWVTMTALHQDVAEAAILKRAGGLSTENFWIVKASGKDYPVRKD